MMTRTRDRTTFQGRRALMLAGSAIMAGLAPIVPPSGAVAQSSNNPTVQVICLVSGGAAQTVRVTYPASAVKNVHVFTPTGGGANVVVHPPATASQVYSLVVPAGSYTLRYATQMATGGYPPIMTSYNQVIVIPPFTIVGRMCQRRQAVGSPSS